METPDIDIGCILTKDETQTVIKCLKAEATAFERASNDPNQRGNIRDMLSIHANEIMSLALSIEDRLK